jgi:hypothetical protein
MPLKIDKHEQKKEKKSYRVALAEMPALIAKYASNNEERQAAVDLKEAVKDGRDLDSEKILKDLDGAATGDMRRLLDSIIVDFPEMDLDKILHDLELDREDAPGQSKPKSTTPGSRTAKDSEEGRFENGVRDEIFWGAFSRKNKNSQ